MRSQLVVSCESRQKSKPYLEALRRMGVSAESIELVTPQDSRAELANLAAHAAGVVLCGGPDLDPSWYGEEARDDAGLSIVPALDRMDWDLLVGAEAGRTPVWAICRGMQTVNVYQGGSLWQDLASQVGDIMEHRPDVSDESIAHPVRILTPRDSFADILGRGPLEVNSRHHQAVNVLGKELVQVAESPDGVLEVLALARPDWWVKGVQWHPENLMHRPEQRQLWSEFLSAAESSARNSGCGVLESREV